MAESLWDTMDAYWIAALTVDLKTARQTNDPLRVATFLTVADWNPKLWTFPVAIVRSDSVTLASETHSDGYLHSDNVYQYVLAAAALFDTYAAAESAAKTYAHRLMESHLSRFALGGLMNDAGTERVQDCKAVRLERLVWPAEGNRNLWYGMGRLDLDIYTTR